VFRERAATSHSRPMARGGNPGQAPKTPPKVTGLFSRQDTRVIAAARAASSPVSPATSFPSRQHSVALTITVLTQKGLSPVEHSHLDLSLR
jgi:hypothetical protein